MAEAPSGRWSHGSASRAVAWTLVPWLISVSLSTLVRAQETPRIPASTHQTTVPCTADGAPPFMTVEPTTVRLFCLDGQVLSFDLLCARGSSSRMKPFASGV